MCSVLHKISGLAQAVSHWPLTKQPRFDPTPIHVRYVTDKGALWEVFSKYSGFILLYSFHQCFTHIHSSTTLQQFSDVESKCSTLRTYT